MVVVGGAGGKGRSAVATVSAARASERWGMGGGGRDRLAMAYCMIWERERGGWEGTMLLWLGADRGCLGVFEESR